MNLTAFLAELRKRDVQVWAENGELRVNAPAGALTPELRTELKQRKSEILAFLASAQTLAGQARALVPLQAHGRGAPVFGVPGYNGDVFCYRALAGDIAAARPLFGLQPPGLDGHSRPLGRIEDVAGYFAAQIIASRPAGPVIIAAYCAGGAVALDLTRQLRQAGQAVALLVLVGCPFPASYRKWRFTMIRCREHLFRLRRNWTRVFRLLNPGYVRDLLQSLRPEAVAGEVNPELPSEQAARQLALQKAMMDAAARYVPATIDVPILQVLPNRQWRHRGMGHDRWRRLTPEYREVVAPDEVTQDTMLKPPHVRLVATALEGQIAYLATGSRPTE